jgi:hypothetical protein
MRRIVLLVTVALVMAAMMLAVAMPAFADHTAGHEPGETGERNKELAQKCQDMKKRPGVSECTPARDV